MQPHNSLTSNVIGFGVIAVVAFLVYLVVKAVINYNRGPGGLS